jgi:hypothetical protein
MPIPKLKDDAFFHAVPGCQIEEILTRNVLGTIHQVWTLGIQRS